MNQTPQLIGLVGKKRSGKDTAASALSEHYGHVRVAFADPLKAVAYDMDPFILRERDIAVGATPSRLSRIIDDNGWEYSKGIPEVRRLLQALGVAVRDHIHPDVWVDAATLQIAQVSAATPVVVTDVRFPNEAERITSMGGQLWRIVRPGLEPTDRHISETALDDWPVDRVIVNDGSIADLHDQIAGPVRA